MARNKIPDDKKKKNIGFTLDKTIDELMESHIKDLKVSRSKYIESLIREDMKKKGFDIEPEF